MIIERNPVIDFRAMDKTIPASLDFSIQPDDSLASYIGGQLPNAKVRKDLQSELDDNEHAIRRWIGAE